MSLRDSLKLPQARLKNPKYYMIDDELVVDHVIRYEYLAADLAAVMSHLGLGSALELPRANGAYRQSGDYRDHFDAETRDWVAAAYKTEIDLFGYRFETPSRSCLMAGSSPKLHQAPHPSRQRLPLPMVLHRPRTHLARWHPYRRTAERPPVQR